LIGGDADALDTEGPKGKEKKVDAGFNNRVEVDLDFGGKEQRKQQQQDENR